MHEIPPKNIDSANNEKEQKRQRIITLAMELGESNENFPFPGIETESYIKMKADEEEYPGFTTPIDEIIERCKNEGIKVVQGKDPQRGEVYILPTNSDNIEMDSIRPRQLVLDTITDARLKELVSLGKI